MAQSDYENIRERGAEALDTPPERLTSSELEHARHDLSEGKYYDAAAYCKLSDSHAQIRQAVALERVAFSLERISEKLGRIESYLEGSEMSLDKLSGLVTDLYDIGPGIQVRAHMGL